MHRNLCSIGDRIGFVQQCGVDAGSPIGMNAGKGPDIGHAAIAQQRDKHRDDVADAVERVKRAAKSFSGAFVERR